MEVYESNGLKVETTSRDILWSMSADRFVDMVLKHSVSNPNAFPQSSDPKSYSSIAIKTLVKERLGLRLNPNNESKLRLMAAKYCQIDKAPSGILRQLETHVEKAGLSMPDSDWHSFFVHGRYANAKYRAVVRRKGPSALTYDEAVALVVLFIWLYKQPYGEKTIRNIDAPVAELERFWSRIKSEYLLVNQHISYEGSPWVKNANYSCSYETFIEILQGLYSGKLPSRSWIYRELSREGKVKNRLFSHEDFMDVVVAIANSSKLRNSCIPVNDFSREVADLLSLQGL